MLAKTINLLPLLAVIIISSAIFLTNLGANSLANWDEAWYADASRFMYRNAHFLTPVWNGQYFFDKPPLQYWLTQPFLYLIGEKEIAYRLPSALSGIALAGLMYLWGKEKFGAVGGVVPTVILLSFPHLIDRARSGNFDTLFILLTTASLWMFTKRKSAVGGLLLGLAWMTKGVFSGFFPPVVLGLFIIYEFVRYKNSELVRSFLIFMGVAALVYVPWYILEIGKFEQLINASYFATLDQGTFGPLDWMEIMWRFNLRYLVFLWTFLRWWFPVLLVGLVVKLKHLSRTLQARGKIKPQLELNDFLPLMVFSVVFLVLSAAKEKNDWYIMPAYPFLALIISDFATKLFPRQKILTLFLVLALAVGNIWFYKNQAFPGNRHLPEKEVALFVKSVTSPTDLIVTAEYEFPTLRYYSEREVRTAAPQPDYGGKYWWIFDAADIGTALRYGRTIITVHRPGTEWTIDVPDYRREKIGEINGRVVSRLVPVS